MARARRGRRWGGFATCTRFVRCLHMGPSGSESAGGHPAKVTWGPRDGTTCQTRWAHCSARSWARWSIIRLILRPNSSWEVSPWRRRTRRLAAAAADCCRLRLPQRRRRRRILPLGAPANCCLLLRVSDSINAGAGDSTLSLRAPANCRRYLHPPPRWVQRPMTITIVHYLRSESVYKVVNSYMNELLQQLDLFGIVCLRV